MTSSEPNPWERYRLAAQKSERQSEGHHLDSTAPYSHQQAPPSRGGGRVSRWWRQQGLSTSDTAIIIVALLGLLATSAVLFQSSGIVSTGAFGLIALVPLGLVTVPFTRDVLIT